jgi:hypothetical protein
MPVDPAFATVLITAGSEQWSLVRVDATGCTSAVDEWYLDSEDNQIVLCPNTCSELENSPDESLEARVACHARL